MKARRDKTLVALGAGVLAAAFVVAPNARAQEEGDDLAPPSPTKEETQKVDRPRTPGPTAGTPQEQPKPEEQTPPEEQAKSGEGDDAMWRKASAEAQSALVHVRAAITALEQDQIDEAKKALDASAASLRDLYMSGPSEIVHGIDKATQSEDGSRDFAPITTAISQYQVYMDPALVGQVSGAEKKAARGDEKAATRDLRLARERIVADIALLPIEQTYTRVLAAQQAISDGDKDIALRFLSEVPITVAEVQVQAPLVPVRFDLRAAANALDQKDTERARELVKRASDQLQTFMTNADARYSDKLKPLADQLAAMDKRFESGKSPKAAELRKMAQRTRIEVDLAS